MVVMSEMAKTFSLMVNNVAWESAMSGRWRWGIVTPEHCAVGIVDRESVGRSLL